jgi:hypothetical protein
MKACVGSSLCSVSSSFVGPYTFCVRILDAEEPNQMGSQMGNGDHRQHNGEGSFMIHD